MYRRQLTQEISPSSLSSAAAFRKGRLQPRVLTRNSWWRGRISCILQIFPTRFFAIFAMELWEGQRTADSAGPVGTGERDSDLPKNFWNLRPFWGLFRNSRNRGASELSDSGPASRTTKPALTRIVVALQDNKVGRRGVSCPCVSIGISATSRRHTSIILPHPPTPARTAETIRCFVEISGMRFNNA